MPPTDYAAAVCRCLGVPMAEVVSGSERRPIARARMIAAALLVQDYGLTGIDAGHELGVDNLRPAEIARYFARHPEARAAVDRVSRDLRVVAELPPVRRDAALVAILEARDAARESAMRATGRHRLPGGTAPRHGPGRSPAGGVD
jgi:hypothetical protein